MSMSARTGGTAVGGRVAAAILLGFMVTAACLVMVPGGPPPPLPTTAPASEFSADRAMVFLEAIARQAHPVASVEHTRVREYLTAALAALGVDATLHVATGVDSTFRAAGRVENVIGRLGGSAGRRDALALVAHYDSTPGGPGAADDGAGVAALLETLRAIQAGPRLTNDLVFLFTDGEEQGLLGASAFVAKHPWAQDVRLVLNFEARGNAGPSCLYETSDRNGELVRQFASVAPRPSGSSLVSAVSRYLPNDSDMSVFKARGIAGLNFAFADRWAVYHTRLDTPAALDRGSLQHHGDYALSLARRFGNRTLSDLNADDRIYFALSGWLVHYPARFTPWLTAAAFAGLVLVARSLARRGAASCAQMQWGVAASILGILLSGGAAYAFARLAVSLHDGWLPEGDVVRSREYLLALCATVAALWLALYRLVRNKLPAEAMFVGALTVWTALSVAAAAWLRGASYLLLWPLLGGLLSAHIGSPADAAGRMSPIRLLATCLCAAPALTILLPASRDVAMMLGLLAPGAVALGVLVSLGLAILSPQLERVSTARPWLMPVALLIVGSALSLTAAVTLRYDVQAPKPSIQVYALDTDAGRAVWANTARRVDAWSGQFLTAAPTRGSLEGFFFSWVPTDFLQHAAPLLPLEGPEVAVLEDRAIADGRRLRIRVASRRMAPGLEIEAPGADVLESSVDGNPVERPTVSRRNPRGIWFLVYANAPREGFEVTLTVRGRSPLHLIVQDRSTGLPEVPGRRFRPRTDRMMGFDVTLVRRTFVV